MSKSKNSYGRSLCKWQHSRNTLQSTDGCKTKNQTKGRSLCVNYLMTLTEINSMNSSLGKEDVGITAFKTESLVNFSAAVIY